MFLVSLLLACDVYHIFPIQLVLRIEITLDSVFICQVVPNHESLYLRVNSVFQFVFAKIWSNNQKIAELSLHSELNFKKTLVHFFLPVDLLKNDYMYLLSAETKILWLIKNQKDTLDIDRNHLSEKLNNSAELSSTDLENFLWAAAFIFFAMFNKLNFSRHVPNWST